MQDGPEKGQCRQSGDCQGMSDWREYCSSSGRCCGFRYILKVETRRRARGLDVQGEAKKGVNGL